MGLIKSSICYNMEIPKVISAWDQKLKKKLQIAGGISIHIIVGDYTSFKFLSIMFAVIGAIY